MQSKNVVKVCQISRLLTCTRFVKHANLENSQGILQERNVSQRPLDVIQSNVWGPIENVSLVRNKYYVTFVDDHTRKEWVYFMKSKGEVFEHFKSFKKMVGVSIYHMSLGFW